MFGLYYKVGNDYVAVPSTSNLVTGDTVIITTYNEKYALLYTTSTNTRWEQGDITTENGYITSTVTNEMKWVYNDSTKTLSHDGHLFCYKGVENASFILWDAKGLGWSPNEGEYCFVYDDPKHYYFTWFNFAIFHFADVMPTALFQLNPPNPM